MLVYLLSLLALTVNFISIPLFTSIYSNESSVQVVLSQVFVSLGLSTGTDIHRRMYLARRHYARFTFPRLCQLPFCSIYFLASFNLLHKLLLKSFQVSYMARNRPAKEATQASSFISPAIYISYIVSPVGKREGRGSGICFF